MESDTMARALRAWRQVQIVEPNIYQWEGAMRVFNAAFPEGFDGLRAAERTATNDPVITESATAESIASAKDHQRSERQAIEQLAGVTIDENGQVVMHERRRLDIRNASDAK